MELGTVPSYGSSLTLLSTLDTTSVLYPHYFFPTMKYLAHKGRKRYFNMHLLKILSLIFLCARGTSSIITWSLSRKYYWNVFAVSVNWLQKEQHPLPVLTYRFCFASVSLNWGCKGCPFWASTPFERRDCWTDGCVDVNSSWTSCLVY